MKSAAEQELAKTDYPDLARRIKQWGQELGFQQVGIADSELGEAEARLLEWLGKGFHGEMDYMARHGTKRTRPGDLVPGTLRVIVARMNYTPPGARDTKEVLEDGSRAFISRYALGRDYHKLMRSRMQKLADRIGQEVGEFRYRVFADSAPVMEVELAGKAGLGWRGKHTLLLNREAGSYFFLGEIYTDLPLPVDKAQDDHCGTCQKCIDVCPTQAILGPYQLDARRCISYLTIELKGHIPREFRAAIGNRVYGCDDCLAVCPWNKYAAATKDYAFIPRAELTRPRLADYAALDDAAFRKVFRASPIKRIGRDRFIRNILIAIGNSGDPALAAQAERLLADAAPIVRAAAIWALSQLLPPDRFAALAAAHAPREPDDAVCAEWSKQ